MPAKLVATVLGTPDPPALAVFYRDLLGWPITSSDRTWARLRHPDDDRPGLSFQLETDHTPPVWPQQPGDQQMQAHLDVQVDDLEAETARAVSLGATVEDHQPQPDGVRVIRDPHGHVLCLFLPGF
ncbi:VOC family protein [Kribbella sp. NPDC058245]|uniref:VOC family protein n=1 Tax=Kribbella sp. NPDC058245 TaxID=3346399 RepID=UPI0036EA35ED